MRQRIACALIGSGMSVICALVALLLSDALAPGRFPPLLGFYGACAAGALLIGGLVLLDRGGARRPARPAAIGADPYAFSG